MIFVTVGTTSFDSLIKTVDCYFNDTTYPNEILYQIGNGEYQPKTGSFFRFKPSIDDLINEADVVITHGGTTVISLLLMKKKFVTVANTDLADDHQTKFLKKINQVVPIFWTNNLHELPNLIDRCISTDITTIESNNFQLLINDITHYVENI